MPTLFATCAVKTTVPCLMLLTNVGQTCQSWCRHSHQGCTVLLELLQPYSSMSKRNRSIKFLIKLEYSAPEMTFPPSLSLSPPPPFFLSFSSGPQIGIFCLFFYKGLFDSYDRPGSSSTKTQTAPGEHMCSNSYFTFK
jgi:hypothetical protein